MSDRAATPHLPWNAEALWAALAPVLPGITVEVLARCDSTNTRLLERARQLAGDPGAPVSRPGRFDETAPPPRTPHGRRHQDIAPCLLVAEHQTRGRGRLGRDWHSEPGVSLTFSLALPLAPAQWGGLSLAVGLALAEALEPLAEGAAPRLVLKWPNDLWIQDAPGQGRKLGGILIETVSVGQHRLCVVGVGLNVAPAAAPEGLTLNHGRACLSELAPGLSAPQALARIAVPLAQALKAFERDGFEGLQAAYTRRDLLRGQRVSASGGTLALQGTAEGVDPLGALCLRTDQGLERVVSGEVSVRLAAPGT